MDDTEDVFSFRPDAPFYVQVGLSTLGVLIGVGMLLGALLGPLGVPYAVAGVALAAIGGWTVRRLRRTWVNRPELHLSAYGVWVATVHTTAGLRWAELAELGVCLHEGAEHLVARPIDPTPAENATMRWSEDLRGWVVGPLDGWDRSEDELRAAARSYAGDRWADPLRPPD